MKDEPTQTIELPDDIIEIKIAPPVFTHNVLIGPYIDCMHDECVVIGSNLKTTHDRQLLIGNQEITTSRTMTDDEFKRLYTLFAEIFGFLKERDLQRIADLEAQLAHKDKVVEVLAREVSFARTGDDGKTRQVSEIIAEAKAKEGE